MNTTISQPRRARSRLRWLAVPITLAAFSMLTVGYLSSLTSARIVDNGRVIEIRTLQSTVDGVLRDAGVELRPEDIVEPALSTPVKRDATITITRARLVRLTFDGREPRLIRTQHKNARQLLADAGYTLEQFDALRVNGVFVDDIPALPRLNANASAQVNLDPVVAEIDVRRAIPLAIQEDEHPPIALRTTALTVGEALLQAGHLIYLADRVQPDPGTPVTADMKVVVQRSKPVTVWVDGRAVRSRTHSKSVSELLAEMNIILLENDYTRPGLDEPVTAGMEVRVVRVSRQVQIRQEAVPFQSRWEPDPELEIDNTALRHKGAPGVREQRDVVIYEDGLEVRRERVADFVARPVQDRVNTYGTKIVLRTLDTPQGPVQYWRKIRMLATSYSASTAGVSRSKSYYGIARCGQTMRRGIVAVDPRIIPLGTNVYIPGYGVGFACDTGSGILGKRIDLGYGDLDLEWWSRYVDVYILAPAPTSPRYRLE